MKAVVLVGGFGTRLRPLTFSIPKPLLPVGDRPLIEIVIERLRTHGVQEVILATGYHAELIRAFCDDGRKFGVDISYVHEQEPLGTAGPLSLVRGQFEPDERFILMNGDVLTRLDFGRMAEFGAKGGYDLVTGYTSYEYQSPFGVLSVEGDRITGIVEKPRTEYPVSAGIYVVKGSILDLVPDGSFYTMPELISALLAAGCEVGAFRIDELWIGLETIARFDEAIQRLQELSDDASIEEISG
jgi:NDP-sugar pyrophosphorylase family protein